MSQNKKEIFKSIYSNFYDRIYSKKNYLEEVKLIDLELRKYKQHIKNPLVLDIGCGTGGHLIELLNLGYNVIGIDNSNSMLEIAYKKLLQQGFSTDKILKLDAANVHDIKQSFDFVIIMFNVIGYLKNFESFFKNLKKILKKGSFVIFDFWDGESVQANKPKPTEKKFKYNGFHLTKKSIGTIQHLNTIKVDIQMELKKDDKLSIDKEIHYVKFFYCKYLEEFFKKNNYKIIYIDKKEIRKLMKSKSGWEAICLIKNE